MILEDSKLLNARVTWSCKLDSNSVEHNIEKAKSRSNVSISDDKVTIDFTKIKANSFELIYIVDGEMIFSYGEKKLFVKKDDIIILPKRQENRYYAVSFPIEKSLEKCCMINVCFDASEGLIDDIYAFSSLNNIKVKNDFLKIQKVWDLKQTGYFCACNSCLYDIISYLQILSNKEYLPSNQFKIIKPAIDYISQNCFEKDFDYSKLAELSGVSYTYFKKLFKKKYNTTPSQFVLNTRMNKAKELLEHKMMSVSQIAFEVGYDSVYYFSKVFKEYFGASPKKYHD